MVVKVRTACLTFTNVMMNDILGPGDENNLDELAHDDKGVETKDVLAHDDEGVETKDELEHDDEGVETKRQLAQGDGT